MEQMPGVFSQQWLQPRQGEIFMSSVLKTMSSEERSPAASLILAGRSGEARVLMINCFIRLLS